MAARQLFSVLLKSSRISYYKRDSHFSRKILNYFNYNNFNKSLFLIGNQKYRYHRTQDHPSHHLYLFSAVIAGLSFSDEKTKEDPVIVKVESKTEEDDDDQIIMVLKRAKLKEIRQEFSEAEELYHNALGLLNIYQQQKSWEGSRILQARVYIHDGMANLALARGQLEKAEKLYKETMKGALQQGMASNDDAIVEISLKLAMIYAAQKKTDDALVGYRFCVNTQMEKVKKMTEVDSNSAALLGMVIDAFAKFLITQKMYQEALTYLEQALHIAKLAFGEIHPQIAVLLNDIATMNSLTNNYELAKHNLEAAIDVAEKTNSLDLPTFYLNFGAVLEYLGDLKQAKLIYSKALTIATKNKDKIVCQKSTEAINLLKRKLTKTG